MSLGGICNKKAADCIDLDNLTAVVVERDKIIMLHGSCFNHIAFQKKFCEIYLLNFISFKLSINPRRKLEKELVDGVHVLLYFLNALIL